jgi:hypothetical protein
LEPLAKQGPPFLEIKSTKAALKRLAQRVLHAGAEILQLLLNGTAETWESVFEASFDAGMSLELSPETIQSQVRTDSCKAE